MYNEVHKCFKYTCVHLVSSAIHTQTHTYTCAYIYTHTHMHICIYICTCMFMKQQLKLQHSDYGIECEAACVFSRVHSQHKCISEYFSEYF
jgi:hypothetical protein